MRELLLCPPDHYGIEYEINPWMSRARGAETESPRRNGRACTTSCPSLDCKIHLVPPQPKLPDMVFTANAGLTVGRKFIPSNFRHEERAGEAPHFAQWMEEHGYEITWLPKNSFFEGEGDALFGGDALFCGYKFRTDIQSRIARSRKFLSVSSSRSSWSIRASIISTPVFVRSPDGGAFWFPAAFDEYGQRAIRDHMPNLIDVAPEEAAHFSCNAVVLERDIVLPGGRAQLVQTLEERGYQCHPLPMTEFLKAGGACKCLTMFMPQREKCPNGA